MTGISPLTIVPASPPLLDEPPEEPPEDPPLLPPPPSPPTADDVVDVPPPHAGAESVPSTHAHDQPARERHRITATSPPSTVPAM
jgi:hypothetical protein